MRIVSLLPSATEIVCALGLQDQLVGVTHECDYPPSVRSLPAVTRSLIPAQASSREIDTSVRESLAAGRALYTLDRPVLEKLRPDLIVTQALCDVCAVAEEEVRAAACSLPGAPRVINLEPQTLAEVIHSIRVVGQAAGVADMAEEVVRRMHERVRAVAARSGRLRRPPRVVLLEWLDPPFSCGHWSPEIIRLAGGIELLGRAGQASRTLRWDEVLAADPDAIVVACCGFDLERTMRDLRVLQSSAVWNQLSAVQAGRVYVVDGSQYFSRPGPRLVDSLEIAAHALHPLLHPLPAGIPPAMSLAACGTVGAA